MIEIPRAALTADEIAKEADFFCFGTNDLTQMTYGFSRDDAGKFLDAYYDAKIFENDPFAKLDQVGVGKLMEMAIELGKPVNPKPARRYLWRARWRSKFCRVLQQASVLTMYLAHHSVYRSLVLQQHRQQLPRRTLNYSC